MRNNVLYTNYGEAVVSSLTVANEYYVFRKDMELKVAFVNKTFQVVPIQMKYRPQTLIPLELPKLKEREIKLLYELRKIF